MRVIERDVLHFASVDGLLHWAYAGKGITTIHILAPGMPTDQSLVVEEIEQALDPRSIEYLRARFKREYSFDYLRRWVLAGLPTGIHYGRGIEKMILDYMGHKIGPASLRKDLHCKTEKADEYRRITKERLDAIYSEASRTLTPLCEQRGWI